MFFISMALVKQIATDKCSTAKQFFDEKISPAGQKKNLAQKRNMSIKRKQKKTNIENEMTYMGPKIILPTAQESRPRVSQNLPALWQASLGKAHKWHPSP